MNNIINVNEDSKWILENKIVEKFKRLAHHGFLEEWMNTKIPAYNWRTPKEMIQSGNGEEVFKSLDQIKDGVL